MKHPSLPWIGLALRVFLGGYFLYAAMPKIVQPYEFATAIGHYEMLPHQAIYAFALVMPWIEVIVGVMLLLGFRTRTAAVLCGAMLVMFTIAVAVAWARGLQIDCGCFGEGNSEEVGLVKVLKNSAMIAACVWLALKPHTALDAGQLRRSVA